MKNHQNLVWLDMEMTGLDPERHHIIEVATIITDSELNVLAQGPVLAIHQPPEILALMDEWCQKTHGNSGLTARVQQSDISLAEAERQTLAFIGQWVEKNQAPLCGNSIGQDRRFIYKFMPDLADYLHYRSLDVSSIKELVKRWQPSLLAGFSKKNTHLALDDIQESIAELRYYREHFFKF